MCPLWTCLPLWECSTGAVLRAADLGKDPHVTLNNARPAVLQRQRNAVRWADWKRVSKGFSFMSLHLHPLEVLPTNTAELEPGARCCHPATFTAALGKCMSSF